MGNSGVLLRQFHQQTYSERMISEFEQLSKKIEQLAALATALRHENAELRLNLMAVSAEHRLGQENTASATADGVVVGAIASTRKA
jgi:hypothetical protein